MRRFFAVLMAVVLVSGLFAAAHAELFLGQPPAEWADRPTLKWTCFDVDEGDAHLLECGGEAMLIDGGPNPFREPLRMALEERGLKDSMKYVLNTHYHDDHINGIYHLFKSGFMPGEFLHPYNDWAIRNDKLGTRTVNAAKKAGIPIRRVQPGDVLTLGDATIELFQCTEYSGTNQRSLVEKVKFGDATILMCADIAGTSQRYFVETLTPEQLKSDLIKLPHHAITPVVPAFLDAVNPLAAIATNIKDEIDNKSITQLEGRPFPTLYSGDGTVYAETDGTDWYIYQTPDQF